MTRQIAAAARLHLGVWATLILLLAGAGATFAFDYPQGNRGPADAPSLTAPHDRPDAVLPDHGVSVGTRMAATGPEDTEEPPATPAASGAVFLASTGRAGIHSPAPPENAAPWPGLRARAPPAS